MRLEEGTTWQEIDGKVVVSPGGGKSFREMALTWARHPFLRELRRITVR